MKHLPKDLVHKHVFKGQAIFREDDVADCAYLLQSGAVAIIKSVEREQVRLATLYAVQLFGEMAVIDNST